jgi:hypothetical protein
LGQHIFGRHLPRWTAALRHLIGKPAEQRVHRSGDASESPQEYDLAIEIVGLDAARPPCQTLPGRSASSGLSRDGLGGQQVTAALRIFLLGGEGDTGRAQAGLALTPRKLSNRPDWRAAGPQTASMALPRLVSSLAYLTTLA